MHETIIPLNSIIPVEISKTIDLFKKYNQLHDVSFVFDSLKQEAFLKQD